MRIVDFPNTWLTRPEMAALLGISERTVTRRVDAGQLVRRSTPAGNLYAFAGHETGQDMSRESAAQNQAQDIVRQPRQDTRQDETSGAILDRIDQLETRLVDGLLARIAELEARVSEYEKAEQARLLTRESARSWSASIVAALKNG